MITEEKSQLLAAHIGLITSVCQAIDWSYVTEASHDLFNQASFQDAISILKPAHSQLKQNELLREQAHALRSLANFHNTLQKCTELKAEISKMVSAEEKIQSLFL